MKYEFMEEHRDRFRLKSMCRVLRASRSGYYAWKSRMPSERQRANGEMLDHIRKVHAKSRMLYGSPRITLKLKKLGYQVSQNRVAAIMKKEGLRSVIRKKFVITTDSKHNYPVVGVSFPVLRPIKIRG